MTGLTVIATVQTVFASSNAPDKRPYAHLDVSNGGYVSLWAKANDPKAVKVFKSAKLEANKTYCFENIGIHDSNVIVYPNSKITEVGG